MPGIRHLQLRLEGLMGLNQTWSVNPKFSYAAGAPAIPTQASMDAWVNALAATSAPVLPGWMGAWSTFASATGFTASFINEANVAVVIAKAVLDPADSGVGSPAMPSQSSLVTTLQSSVPGRSGRGRLYWPCLAASLDPDTARISSGFASGVAISTAAWLHDVEDAWPNAGEILASVVSLAKGVAYPISSVRVGDVIDTQRRRRDQMLENYSTAPM